VMGYLGVALLRESPEEPQDMVVLGRS
jgi:hypothetical protein